MMEKTDGNGVAGLNRICSVEEFRTTGEGSEHLCEHWTLLFCTGGRGSARLEDGTLLRCRKGDLVAVRPGQRYTIIPEQEFSGVRLILEDPSFPHTGAFRISDENGSLRTAFRQAALYRENRGENGQPVLVALGDLISAYITVLGGSKKISEPIEQIRSAILRDYSRTDFSPDQVIRRMPFHYDYLRKRFKQETGQSPLEYLTALRMEQAGKLLGARRETGHTIARIARMCGYEDALYFSRVFKKHYGCTPTAFSRNKE